MGGAAVILRPEGDDSRLADSGGGIGAEVLVQALGRQDRRQRPAAPHHGGGEPDPVHEVGALLDMRFRPLPVPGRGTGLVRLPGRVRHRMVEARGPEAGGRGTQVADDDVDGAAETVCLDVLPAQRGKSRIEFEAGDDAALDAAGET